MKTPVIALRCVVFAAILVLGPGCVADEPGEHRIVPKDPTQLESAVQRGTPEGEGDQGPVERGEALFTGRGVCSACHGPDGGGTQIAPDLTDDDWLHIEEPITVEKIAAVIMDGISNPIEHPGMMPPRGGGALSNEEVEMVAAYVMALRH